MSNPYKTMLRQNISRSLANSTAAHRPYEYMSDDYFPSSLVYLFFFLSALACALAEALLIGCLIRLQPG